MPIHTFGDSHSSAGWVHIPGIKIHAIGSILAYSLGREAKPRFNIADRRYNVKENDTVIFCLGEIDCRGHVHKHIRPNKSYQQVIDEVIINYFRGIEMNARQFHKLRVCVYNAVPPIEKDKVAIQFQVDNPTWPFLGTNEERLLYHRYFNKCVADECAKRGYVFVDIFDKYADENGFLREDLSDGITHIKDPQYLKEFINNVLL
jgi:hypothetical protein